MFEKEGARLPVKNLELQGAGPAYSLQETRRPENKVRSQWTPQGRARGCTLSQRPRTKFCVSLELGMTKCYNLKHPTHKEKYLGGGEI